MALAAPSSQKASDRPIAFVLDDQTDPQASPVQLSLVIRPEELTRTEPSRLATHHTFGGAFADSFGAGVSTISLSGVTGWRRMVGDSQQAGGADGEERFRQLRDQVFAGWHARRHAAVNSGQDPAAVRLVLADGLDKFAVVVAPNSFTLRRSRSRPLLCQFQIQLTVLSDSIDAASPALDFDGRSSPLSGLESLAASIDKITGYVQDVQEYIDATLVAPVKGFMDQTATLYRSVDRAVRSVDGVAGSLITTAQLSAQAGMNLFRSLGAVVNLPTRIRSRMMQVSSAYSNVWCVLNNTLRNKAFYDDYSPLYGSSNCSSTFGGRPLSPLAGTNPFAAFAGAAAAKPQQVQVTPASRAALGALATADPVLAPLGVPALGDLVSTINAGMVVA